MKSNVVKIYAINLLIGLVFWYPIEKLFMVQVGLSPFEISIVAVVFLTTVLLFDVPSGYLADSWKRKYVLAMAAVFVAASSLIYSLADNLNLFLVGAVVYGLYVVCSSGTFQAITYDSLKDLGEERRYSQVQGRSYSLFLAGVGLSSIAGGYFGDWLGYPMTYVLSAVAPAAALILCLSLKEPRAHQKEADSKLFKHVGQALELIKKTPLLLDSALLLAVISLMNSSQNEYAGLYYIALGFGPIATGYFNAGKWFASTIGQLLAGKVGIEVLRYRWLFFGCFLIFALIESPLGLVFLYVCRILNGVFSNKAETQIQDLTPSNIRATTLSAVSFVSNIIFVPISLIFGYVTQKANIFTAYQIIAAIGVVYTIYWLVSRLKIRDVLVVK